MYIKNSLRDIWIVIAAFFISRCQVFDIYPFAVGFFSASCITNRSYILTFIAIMAGTGLRMSVVELVRYGLMLLAIGVATSVKNRMEYNGGAMLLAFISGLMASTVDVGFYFIARGGISPLLCAFEGMLVFSSAMIYSHAIHIVTEDYMKVATENDAAISVILLAASVLYGMPLEIGGGIVLALAFGIFSALFSIYKFGFGLGMAWTVISGAMLSYMTRHNMYIVDFMLMALSCYALQCLIHGGRYLFTLIYVAVYFGFGLGFDEGLIDETGIKAVLSAVFIFLLLPSHMLVQIDSRMAGNELASESSEWGRLVIGRLNNLASAFKRIEYTLSGNVNTGIGLNDVGELIEGFTNQLEREVPLKKTATAKIIDSLAIKGAGVKNLVMLKNRADRYEIYVTLRMNRGRLMTAEAVRQIVERETGLSLVLKDESRTIVSRNYNIICMQEKPEFKCVTAVRRMSRYAGEISGDNFYIGSIMEGYELIMISDGMGNGKPAAVESSVLIDALEELIAAGFEQDMSIKLVNSYLSDKNRGEHFSTLDMLLIDLHTGYGKIYKQGAATTFIRRGSWLELIKSTSLPVGVIDGAVCEHCSKKFYNDDMIIMVSDGILESMIVENKEDYMRELLEDFDGDEPEELVEYIADCIRSQGGNRLKDDATIIACKLIKSC